MENPIQQPDPATSPTVTSLRWSTATRPGSMPDAFTTSRVRRVPRALSRCGVCTSAGRSCSMASANWWAKTSSSSGVIES